MDAPEVSRVDRDQELALLGVLEGQLGKRQHSLAGLHLEEDASRALHAEMVGLQHRATELEAEREAAAREAADPEAAERQPAGTPRHRRPKRGRIVDLRSRDVDPS